VKLETNRVLLPPNQGRSHLATTIQEEDIYSLSSPTGGEGWGEEADFIEYPLPARFSRGKGEDFWWLYQDAP